MYFSIPFFTRPRTPSTTGIVVVFMPHIFSISFSRSLYFESFSVVFIEVFLSVGTDISIIIIIIDYEIVFQRHK